MILKDITDNSMTDFDWHNLLTDWSAAILASPLGADLPDSARATAWLGLPPADDAQIAAAEARLQIALPPSYKAFLRTSNGWLRTTHAIARLPGVEQADWFRKRNRQWVSAYTKPLAFERPEKTPDETYFAYGTDAAADFRPEHLKETLQVSEVGDAAVYLLNPQVIARDGEWEAWFLADWLPGVRRYRSFQEMMLAEYHQFTGGDWTPPVGVQGVLPDEYAGPPGSPKRKPKKRGRPRVPKIFGKAFNRWTFDELMEMLRNPDFDIVHGEVIQGLTLLNDPRALEPLLALVNSGDVLALTATQALRTLAPERFPDLYLNFLDDPSRPHFLTAAMVMAELKDVRAVAPLIKLMLDVTPHAPDSANYVSHLIPSFGPAGYNALVACKDDPEPTIRRRVIEGLQYSNLPEARAEVEPFLNDRDASVREAASRALQLLPPARRGR